MARVPESDPDCPPIRESDPPPDELTNAEHPGPDDWDPVVLGLLGRLYARAYLHAQAEHGPDE